MRRAAVTAQALPFRRVLSLLVDAASDAGARLDAAVDAWIAEIRRGADEQADRATAPGACARAGARELVIASRWAEQLDGGQRAWVARGAAVRPLAQVHRQLFAMADGAEVPVEPSDIEDVFSGWGVPRSSATRVTWPERSTPPVIEQLGVDVTPFIERVDERVAATYYAPALSDQLGPTLEGRAADEKLEASAQQRLAELDAADEYPARCLVERQISALSEAAVLRQEWAVELAAVIAAAPVAPTARTGALALSWRAGVATAADEIAAALDADPWSVAVLSDLEPVFRRAGEARLADQVQRLLVALGGWISAPVSVPLAPPTHSPMLRGAR